MRFFEDGPAIPDSLLVQSDVGKVVFFCGAGISCYPEEKGQSMPTFVELTEHVFEYLSPPLNSKMGKWIEKRQNREDTSSISLGDVFDELKDPKLFGEEIVNNAVADILNSKKMKGQDLTQHRHIAQISRTQNGRPRVVTTNFDVLFEKAVKKRKMKIHLPPIKMDLSSDFLESGITYLHGRVPEQTTHVSVERNLKTNLLLSTRDFGKAYFPSDPWASNFIHALFSNYTIVFIGYRASDVPIHFMLSGMRDSKENENQRNIYVFDQGELKELNEKWQSRGVQPIPYSSRESLWKTIEAWAKRSRNPSGWKKNVLKMAQVDPRTLKPHERGQVAHVGLTVDGVKLFTALDPVAHPRWICVFDSDIRLDFPFYFNSSEKFRCRPQAKYGLDDDPSNPDARETKFSGVAFKNLQRSKNRKNTDDINPSELPDEIKREMEKISKKCFETWIGRNFDNPIMAWWLARKPVINLDLLRSLRSRLHKCTDIDQNARFVWDLIFEYHIKELHVVLHDAWISFCFCVKEEGWKVNAFHKFKKATTPHLKIEPYYDSSRFDPPNECWNTVELEKIANFVVAFPDRYGKNFEIDDDALIPAMKILQSNFLLASKMRSNILDTYGGIVESATCYPFREVSGDSKYVDFREEIVWFLSLFERLIEVSRVAAKNLVLGWTFDDPYFFRKLKLYALNFEVLFDIDEVYYWIIQLSEEEFWCDNNRRELLFLLKDRWSEFSEFQRHNLTKTVLSPPFTLFSADIDNPNEIAYLHVAIYGRWLVLNGCEFPEPSLNRLNSIVKELGDIWNDNLAVNSTISRYPVYIRMGIDEDPTPLEGLPIHNVIDEADKIARSDLENINSNVRKPFTGFVKDNPESALLALTDAKEKDQYPVVHWKSLIKRWPQEVTSSMSKKFMEQLIQLPLEVLRELKFEMGQYLRDRHYAMLSISPQLAWNIFDRCILAWSDGCNVPDDTGEHGDTGFVPGVDKSRRTYGYAFTQPVGMAVLFLVRAIGDWSTGLPKEVKHRLDRLLKSPGESRHQCVSIMAWYIPWLYRADKSWTVENLFPFFEREHELEEAALSGLSYCPLLLDPEAFEMLGHKVGAIYPRVYDLKWSDFDHGRCAHLVVEAGSIYLDRFRKCKPVITDNLRDMNDDDRLKSIESIQEIGASMEGGWTRFVVPFFNSVWPMDNSFRNEDVTKSLVVLLSHTDDFFPEVFSTVKDFLVAFSNDSHATFNFFIKGGGEDGLISKFPDEVLELFDIVISPKMKYPPLFLNKILSIISKVKKSLEGDRRYRRLHRLAKKADSGRR